MAKRVSEFSEREVVDLTGARVIGNGYTYYALRDNNQETGEVEWEFGADISGVYQVRELEQLLEDLRHVNEALNGRNPFELREAAACDDAAYDAAIRAADGAQQHDALDSQIFNMAAQLPRRSYQRHHRTLAYIGIPGANLVVDGRYTVMP